MKLLKKLALLLIVLIPFNAMAISYEFDKIQDGADGNGVKFIHIKITDVAEDTLKTDKLICAVDSPDATCIIEPLSGFKVENDMIMTESGDPLTDNTSVARIVVTNTTTSTLKTKVTLIYGESTFIEKENLEIAGKEPPKSTDSTLATLTFNVGTIFPEFKPDVNNYTLYNIGDTYPRVKFAYTCDKCSVKFEGGTSTSGSNVSIQKGENEVKIIVTSQDGNNTSTYYLNVIQGATTFNSAKLKSMSLDDYEITPKFSSDKLEYEVTVPTKITNIDKLLKLETEDSKATIEKVGADKLDKDDNEVKITVTAQDGTKTEYLLKVHRENTQEQVIEVIYYKDKKVAFMNTENVREELTEDNFKKQYPTEWAKIEDKTYKFDAEGNIIKNQEVTPEPEVKEPEVKHEEQKSNFPWLIVIIIAVAIIIIVVAGILIFREPKDKDDKEEPQQPTKEEKENLEFIDNYNEEARLIAADNAIKEAEKEEITEENTPIEETTETEENINDQISNNYQEEIVQEEVAGDYVSEEKTPTMDIDEALSDLMNTKEYDFKDK